MEPIIREDQKEDTNIWATETGEELIIVDYNDDNIIVQRSETSQQLQQIPGL